jgi:hypothetical protein
MDALDLVRLRPLMSRSEGRPEIVLALIDGPLILTHPGGAPPTAVTGSAPTSPANGTAIRIVFEAQTLNGPDGGPYRFTNELPKMLVNNWGEVGQLSVVQLTADPCAGIGNSIDIKYTADHELMYYWQVSCSGPTPALPGGATPRGGAGTQSVNSSASTPCAYSVSLNNPSGLDRW